MSLADFRTSIENARTKQTAYNSLLAQSDEAGNESIYTASVFRTIHTVKGTCGFLGFGKLDTKNTRTRGNRDNNFTRHDDSALWSGYSSRSQRRLPCQFHSSYWPSSEPMASIGVPREKSSVARRLR